MLVQQAFDLGEHLDERANLRCPDSAGGKHVGAEPHAITVIGGVDDDAYWAQLHDRQANGAGAHVDGGEARHEE